MSLDSRYTEPEKCQCVFPLDCGNSGCGGDYCSLGGCGDCGPSAGIVDLATPVPPMHARYLSNRLIATCCPACDQIHFDFGNGYNWLVEAWPYVTDKAGTPIFVVLPSRRPLRFCIGGNEDGCPGDGGYVYRPGGCGDCGTETLSEDDPGIKRQYQLFYSNNVFTLKDADGSLWSFAGFEPGTVEKGRFKSYVNGTSSAHVTGYTSYGHIQGIEYQEDGTAAGSIAYEYSVFADDAERVTAATYTGRDDQGASVNLQRVQYTYYGDAEDYGSLGDLKTAVQQEYVDGQWTTLGTYYYRYYDEHRVEFVVEPEAFERLSADQRVGNPLTASNTIVAEYANTYFEYDQNGRISKTVFLGDKTTTYTYEEGDQGTPVNNYVMKTVETQQNGLQRTVYANKLGQVLLEEIKNSAGDAHSTLNFYQYDSDGNLTLHATPSALAGYSVSNYAITPTYKNDSGQYNVGLIHTYEYYDDTTTDTGGSAVKGYKKYDKIKQGRDGTEINVRKYEYTEHSATVELPDFGSSSSSSSGGNSIEMTVYPIAKEISYPNENGSSPFETAYSYTWYPDSVQMLQRTTTLPAVSAGQNGSGSSATRVERFDEFGRLVWLKDERGTIFYKEYELGSQNVTKSIDDVDDTQLTVPSGWSTPAGGGKHLVSDFEYDDLGRLVQTLGPEHNVDGTTVRTASWTVYKTADRETRSGQGYATSNGQGGYNCTLVNPVQIEKRNATGTRSESISAFRASTSGKLTASDTFSQTAYTRWSVNLFNNAGQLTASRAYHSIPSSGDGSSGTNYDETTFDYDAMGRQNKSVTPGGTISRTVFDVRGNAVADYIGTDDSSATDADPTGAGGDPHGVMSGGSSSSSSASTPDPNNNMVLVTEREYCDGSSGCSCGSGGAGHLVSETRHVDGSTSHTTEFEYDWRGRQLHVFPPADDEDRVVYTTTTYDNLDRATKQERFLEISGSADRLLARSETFYDDRGRVYQTKRWAVDVSDGSVGNALVSNTWYDAAGNTIKQQPAGSQAFTKTVYDTLGRAVKQYLGYDTDETAYADASSVSDDTIVEQSETTYDDGGNATMSVTRQRFHNATGTGELTTPSGSQPKARVSYACMYYDEIGRQTATANYGTNGGTAVTRPSSVASRSDTILVTSTEYDDAGRAYKTIDPAGREDRQVFDDAGRVTKTIQNYVDGTVNGAYPDEDVTVEMTYTADGQLETLTAKNPTTGDQTTTYVYGTTLSDSEIATTTLKRAEIYPDSDDTTALGDGADSTYDRIELKYDRQQRVIEVKDQQETVHAFEFDALGRQTQDRVTTLGSGVDGDVRRIATTYDVLGRREKTTSYDNPTVGSGSVANEVQSSYNDFGQLVTEYQEHGGAVNTGTSLKVQYAYADGSSNTIRPTKMTYPDGRELNYNYGSAGSASDALSRVASLIDDDGSTHLVDYSYLGTGAIVKTDYAQPDVRCDLAHGAGYDPYDGPLDPFGRVTDLLWYDYGSSSDLLRFKHGYDRAGNRLYREEADTSDLDQLYSYDDVNRLTQSEEGTLSVGKDSISSLNFAQQWSLDPTGNWSAFREDDDGDSSWDLEQARTSNEVNEITNVTETTGPSWITPAYNRTGNMTTIPQPADPTQSYTATYDAWNRLVKLEDGEDTVAEYVFDGAKRLVVRKKYVSGSLNQTRHFYYTDQWQTIEERLESSGSILSTADRQFTWGQRYIDDLVCRTVDSTHDYAYQDPNWNVILSSSALARVGYQPYGQIRATCAAAQADLDAWQYYFAGYRRDEGTGLYLVRHRVYQPELGCWVQRDPLREDNNTHRYVVNDPLDYVDPSGKSFQPGEGFNPGIVFKPWPAVIYIRWPEPTPTLPPIQRHCQYYQMWDKSLCPCCRCRDTQWGRSFDEKFLGYVWRKHGFPRQVTDHVTLQFIEAPRGYSLTCFASRDGESGKRKGKRRQDKSERHIFVFVTNANTCDAWAMLEHEAIHVRQFRRWLLGADRSISDHDRKVMERAAYNAQCEIYAMQNCLTGEEARTWRKNCVNALFAQSVDDNARVVGALCNELVAQQPGGWEAVEE